VTATVFVTTYDRKEEKQAGTTAIRLYLANQTLNSMQHGSRAITKE
jgi:hypothetical protein